MSLNSSSTNNSLLQKLLTVGLLAAAFLVSAGTVVFLSLKGKEVKVPELTGKTEGEAERLLSEQSLRFKVRNRTTSEKYQEHLVSEQMPPAGSTAKAGQLVTVVVSTGIEAKKEEAKATPKATTSPKPKPSISPSPKKKDDIKDKDKEKEDANKKDTAKEKADSDTKDKDENKDKKDVNGKPEGNGKPKDAASLPKPSPKPSLKPTVKPSPKKDSTN